MTSPNQFPPSEVVVLDEEDKCAYLPGRKARLPLRLPLRRLSAEETDDRWAQGDRRHGFLLYRPSCAGCQACEPIRLCVADFRPNSSQKKALRRGDEKIVMRIAKPTYTADRLALYEKHKSQRKLHVSGETTMGARGYKGFFVDECVESVEFSYWVQGRLAAVAIADRGQRSLSAVYCFYDPDLPSLSLGTYSIMKQLQACRRWGLSHLYLGYFVADNAHMRYKARFNPHERLVGGQWRVFQANEDAG